MDLITQSKLGKSEWEMIEVPVSDKEKQILKLIMNGYHDVRIRTNETQSLFTYVKVDQTEETEYYLYTKYFEPILAKSISKYGKNTPLHNYRASAPITKGKPKKMKTSVAVRLQILEKNIDTSKSIIYEFLLVELFGDLLKNLYKQKQDYAFYLYTILQLNKASIHSVNKYVVAVVEKLVSYAKDITNTSEIITNAYKFIEKNKYLLKYEDKALFSHQKELFQICGRNQGAEFNPKLILYTAPTGTGKTLSPIGLSEKNRIIFVCVARHIGLALAKSAISMEKKVAFAFGCETASDIRLHYFSAIDYTVNKRSGGIWKVDNSVGDNVEIMICDVKSYITAMHYMLAFNQAESIITYWDEPTITMDSEEHSLHETIHQNWMQNQIPTVVLSCATLPSSQEIRGVFDDFRGKFDNADIHTITSYDCRKSISILNKDGYCVLPHYLHEEYRELIQCAEYCMQNKTMLRYFDLREIIYFAEYVNKHECIDKEYAIDVYFGDITNITMNSLKEYYLELLLHMNESVWPETYTYLSSTRKRMFEQSGPAKSSRSDIPRVPGVSLTTSDAYTLTDGPTIFLADDIDKIGAFYIQQTNIASSVFEKILSNININNNLIEKIDKLDRQIVAKEESGTDSSDTKGSKNNSKGSSRMCKEAQEWMNEINKLRKQIQSVALDSGYLPNTKPHQHTWTPDGEIHENAFVSNIGEDMSKTIMMLDVENHMKVLLLLGIGMFTETTNIRYMEIMKQLADEQRLYMIIASTDYIYGTNYQFCHGFIGKDLTKMTQQKTLQAMGRIGRNHIQQDYTVRFRDDAMITSLLQKPDNNLEANNMNKLFCSD